MHLSKKLFQSLSSKFSWVEMRAVRVRRFLQPSLRDSGLKIIGCGRSGTTYTAKTLQQLGLDFGHERLRLNGIASWYLGSGQARVPFGPSMKQLAWLDVPVVHQVREPLSAISSCLAIGKPSRYFLRNESPVFWAESRLCFAMRYWFYWNQKCERIASYTYQVEELDNHLAEILSIGGFKVPERHEHSKVSRKTNARSHPIVNWNQVFEEDSVLAAEIQELGKRYGYH